MSRAVFVLFAFLAAAQLPGLPLDKISSAEVCGRCHRAIQDAWKGSSHARAMDSPLFQDALEAADTEFGASARNICLGCHSPLSQQLGDTTFQRKVTWEGVTCDYCHSIRAVNMSGQNPKAQLEFALIKSGPLKDAVSTAHGTVYSDVHTNATVCAPCHEYKNAQGFPVLTTYTEWKASRYWKEGKQCQSCHMAAVAGDVVDPRIQRSSQVKINLHQMPGSHSVDQLNNTIKAQMNAVREGGRVRVSVTVANTAAGHYVPTGSPLRQVVLEVRADTYNGKHLRDQRVYRRTVADAQGKEIQREHLAFLKAAKEVSDTRLKPDEKRVETFFFDVTPGVATQIKTTFWYYYSPLASTESQKRVIFLTLSRLVN
jgi:hypothetical protein